MQRLLLQHQLAPLGQDLFTDHFETSLRIAFGDVGDGRNGEIDSMIKSLLLQKVLEQKLSGGIVGIREVKLLVKENLYIFGGTVVRTISATDKYDLIALFDVFCLLEGL